MGFLVGANHICPYLLKWANMIRPYIGCVSGQICQKICKIGRLLNGLFFR
ncbi:hypothetical protein X875_16970 [Mannheimia varigena USDA-ARS-USMARC-1388]|nr:hypothetical protein X875_16970 [Mannheimia varigena USDA-ARS-USMARC-1388]